MDNHTAGRLAGWRFTGGTFEAGDRVAGAPRWGLGMIKEIVKEGLKQGGVEVIKSTLIWAAWRIRERYFPDPPPKSAETPATEHKETGQ